VAFIHYKGLAIFKEQLKTKHIKLSSCLELRAAEYLKFDWKIAACLDHKIQRHAGFARHYSHLRWAAEQSSCFLVHHNKCRISQQ
jgi:hypothetical protein